MLEAWEEVVLACCCMVEHTLRNYHLFVFVKGRAAPQSMLYIVHTVTPEPDSDC